MNRARASAGFSLLSAIFILVVMVSAGTFMLNVAGVQRATADLVMLRPQHLESGEPSMWRDSALVRFVQHRLARRRAHTRTLTGYLEAFDRDV